MARSFLKVYFDFDERTDELSDNEKGRLLLAMLRYAVTAQKPVLSGNERFLFSTFKGEIDRDIATYNAKITNGNLGGRPAMEKPNETENNLTKPNKTEHNLNAKKKNKNKEEDIRNTQYPSDTSYSCAEPEASTQPVNIIARITLVDGTAYEISEQEADEDQKAYPGVDVKHEYLMMERWGVANPSKRKTRRGIRKFMNTWLDKEQNRYHPEGGGRHEEHRGNYPGHQRESRTKYDLEPKLIDISV